MPHSSRVTVFAPRNFHFDGAAFDEATATLRLGYRFDAGPLMWETLTFPGADTPLDQGRQRVLERAIEALHLAAGVSYYKAGIPPGVSREAGPLPPGVARFFEDFYREGLGEFAWRNGVSLADRPVLPADPTETWTAMDAVLPERVMVPMGGGKDSIVALEMVREAGIEPTLVSVGDAPLIQAVAGRTGLRHIRIGRRLAPELLELNRQGAWNGHVPITGIIAFILACAAVLYRFDTVVMANERSASSATLVTPDGREVNHQWSKGYRFESTFSDFIERHVMRGFTYFSLLRPLSELDIARRFSRHERYFDVFSSCNRNFTLALRGSSKRWCGECPKCRFVFLMLAPFIERMKLLAMFDADLLDDPAQAAGFDELIGRATHKPFECVGDTAESVAAFCLLTRDENWREAFLVRRFADQVLTRIDDPDALVKESLAASGEHRIPARFQSVLHAA